jgi:hypothetical protein
MAPKYRKDDLVFNYSSSSREEIGKRQSLFKIGTGKIDNYYTGDPKADQPSYFTFDHTHYCLNCRDWYPSKQSVFECKLQHATVTHTEHVTYCA